MRRRSSGRPTMQVRELSPTNESRRTCVNLLALNGRCAPRRPSARIHSCIPHVTTHQRHYSAPLGSAKYCDERVCVCACAFVCLRSYIRNYTSDLHRVFLHMLPMAVARFSSGGVVVCYVGLFPVLWTTSYLFISKGCSTSPPN